VPRQIDLSPQNLQVTHNPLNQLAMTPNQLTNLVAELTNLPELALEAIEQGITQFLTYLDQVTGLDLLPFWTAVEAVISSLTTLFGELNPGGGTFNPVAALETLLNLIVTNAGSLPGTLFTDLAGLWGGLDQALRDAITNALGISGTGNPLSAVTSALQNFPGGNIVGTIEAAVNASNLFGSIPTNMFSLIPAGSIASTTPNLLTNPEFNGAGSINGAGIWTWDNTVYYTTGTGSAKVTANGVAQTLESNVIPVSSGQTINFTGNALAQSLTGTGTLIELVAVPYIGTSPQTTVVVASATGAGSSPTAWAATPSGSVTWPLSGSYPVTGGVDSVRMGLVVTAAATSGNVWFANCVAQQSTNLIPFGNVSGLLGPDNIGSALQTTVDSLWQAFTGGTSTGLGLGALSGAANQTAATASSAVTVGQNNSTTLAQRAVTKPSYLGLDPSGDTTIPWASLAGSSLPTIPITSASSVIGMIGIPDGGVKESVFWDGSYTGTISGLYVNIYSLNTSTGALTLVYASANYISSVSSSATMNYFNLPSASYVNTSQGQWYAVEIAVTGSGTYSIAGVQHQGSPNPNIYPKQLGATRNTSGGVTAPSTISTVSYSTSVPFLGVSGSAGASEIAPQTTEYSTAGTFTYTVPAWMVAGDHFDIIVLGGGGGGGAWISYFNGTGGNAGSWTAITLQYGVDIPLSTTSFTGTVAAGGAGGNVASGSAGSASSVVITGYGTISAAGGTGGAAANDGPVTGVSPGTETFDGQPYYGGSPQSTTGASGNAPGGGGSGGQVAQAGGHGATGAVWIRAYQ
jgi:hypothetical protein